MLMYKKRERKTLQVEWDGERRLLRFLAFKPGVISELVSDSLPSMLINSLIAWWLEIQKITN